MADDLFLRAAKGRQAEHGMKQRKRVRSFDPTLAGGGDGGIRHREMDIRN
jgi:hypothetical protein